MVRRCQTARRPAGRQTDIPDNGAAAVFVGTEFDSVAGRGGSDGTPHRRTPWGEIAYQLGGDKAFTYVADHDKDFIEPKGDVIEKILPRDRPCLTLMDILIPLSFAAAEATTKFRRC